VIFVVVWVFYLNYEGTTPFDINETLTLPLLIAAEYTGLALLYAIWRYAYDKRGKDGKDSKDRRTGS
jgi:hypothetical protein